MYILFSVLAGLKAFCIANTTICPSYMISHSNEAIKQPVGNKEPLYPHINQLRQMLCVVHAINETQQLDDGQEQTRRISIKMVGPTRGKARCPPDKY
jgi:hypothetical protein